MEKCDRGHTRPCNSLPRKRKNQSKLLLDAFFVPTFVASEQSAAAKAITAVGCRMGQLFCVLQQRKGGEGEEECAQLKRT